MPIFKQNTEIKSIKKGTQNIKEVYRGNTLVWKRYRPYVITIDATKVDSTLSNFPVMVKANSSNFDMSLLGSDNVYFTLTNGNLLDFEIEYATTSERIYHVKIPTISSSSDTQFILQSDGSGYSNGRNATSTWSSSYRTVLHMNSTISDSSPFNTSTDVSGITTITGLNGQAKNWDGSTGNYILLGDIQGGRTTITWSAVARTTNTYSDNISYQLPNFMGLNQASSDSQDLNFSTNGGNLESYDELDIGTISTNAFVADGNWHHIVLVKDGSTKRIYKDGVEVGSRSGSNEGLNSRGMEIGRAVWTDNTHYDGDLDSVLITNGARNSAWIKAEYHSLFNTLISNVVLN